MMGDDTGAGRDLINAVVDEAKKDAAERVKGA
jgi:hypothetical protein